MGADDKYPTIEIDPPDLLGEALALWDARAVPLPDGSVLPEIVAAARNWHTRSEPDYLAAAKKLAWWLSEAEWEDIDDEIAGEWIVQARSIVDAALTDTAEPEAEGDWLNE